MTTTVDITTTTTRSVGRTADRVASVAATAFAICLFMTVAVMNVPHDASDTELVRWWQEAGNRTTGVVSGLFALGVAVSLPVLTHHLLAHREASAAPAWSSFARAMSGAVTAVWLVTGALRGSLGHLVDTMGEPLPGADVLRFSTAANYMLLGQLGMSVLAAYVLAMSVLVLRTGLLARWVGYVGVGCATVTLGAVAAQYGAFTTPLAILWGLCVAVALLRRRPGTPA